MPPNVPQTLLPLEAFRQQVGWFPFYFWQLANSKIPLTDSSDLLLSEYQWQRPAASARYDLRRAIQVAEQKLSTALNYDVATRYRSEAYAAGFLRHLPRTFAYGNWGGYASGFSGSALPGYGPALLQLNVGKLQRIGTVSYTQLVDSATLVYSDGDGDTLEDTFTATFADSTSDPAKVVIAFSAADQPTNYGTAASANPLDWQVRPVTVTRLDATTLQAVGPAWLLVKPTKYEQATTAAGYNSGQTGVSSSGSIDPDIAANFVTGLTAWLKVYSNEGQATFVRRYGTFEETRQVDATIIDPELGQVQINLAGCASGPVPSSPSFWSSQSTEEVRINYEAGATSDFRQAQYLQYQTDWDTITARLAIAELPQPTAATQTQNPQLFYWRQDLALTGSTKNDGTGQGFRVSNDILKNGFLNTRRGAVDAWQAVQTLALHRAMKF